MRLSLEAKRANHVSSAIISSNRAQSLTAESLYEVVWVFLMSVTSGEHSDVPVRISVLIPALNEAAIISAVVQHAKDALPEQELIVIDGNSVDDTATIAATQAKVLRSSRSRGASLNEAAALAVGDVVLFLHADTRLPNDAYTEILRVLRDSHVVGGAFRFSFDERSAIARVIAAWVNLRSRSFNVFFGDQALFIRKDVFLRAGGFRDWNLMEDFEILHRLRRLGTLRLTRSAIATSARRHVEDGWLRTMGTVWLVTWLHFFGVSPDTLAALYRRRSGRRIAKNESGPNS